MKWYSIIYSLPKKWKSNLDMSKFTEHYEEDVIVTFSGVSLSLKECKTKFLTQIFVAKNFTEPKAKIYFEHLLHSVSQNWEDIYTLPFKLTVDTKLRNFQWKLTHNILMTNHKLNKIMPTKVVSPLCNFCKQENETIIHLFYECKLVETFWSTFIESWGQYFHINTMMTAGQVLFGDVLYSNLFNFLIISCQKIYLYQPLPTGNSYFC